MTIQEVITQCDELKPNQYDYEQKINWLDEIEGKIWKEIMEQRVPDVDENGNPVKVFHGYHIDTDAGTELLADMYSELYLYYLMAKIDFFNGETQRYNVDSSMFNEAYMGFADYYYRAHASAKGAVMKNL